MATSKNQKQRILETAARLFAKHGYDGTGIAELGAAVGLGRGALYHHIGSKETLLYQISMAHVREMVAFGDDLLEKELEPEEKLRRLAERLMITIGRNLPEVTVFFADFRSLTGDHRRRVVEERERFEAIWGAILEEGVRMGRFRPVHPLAVKGLLGIFNYSYVWLRPGE